MARFSVDVELKILVVVEEAAPPLEDGEVWVVALREHVDVVAVRELRLHLHHLSAHAWPPYRVYVRPVSWQASTVCLTQHRG